MRLSTPPRLPTIAGPPKRPQAPRFVPKDEYIVNGPGEPPPGFLDGQNSLTEWIVYWSLAKIFRNPADPRIGPFFGAYPDWGYQVAALGGFVRALGSAVVDFVVYQGRTMIAIRVQTEFFHIYTSSKKQAYDEIQRARLEKAGMTVVDLYDQDILGDPSGQKAIVAVKQVIGRIERINPVIGGTAIRGSRLRPVS